MAGSLLITGATGGLGLALVQAARAQGYEVLATGRSRRHEAAITQTGARFMAADLTDAGMSQSLCEGQASIIHAAALSSSWGPKSAFQRANVDVTRYLLGAARQQNVGRFVYISSPSIFAQMRDQLSIKAGHAPVDPPLNFYAQTKLAGERLVLAAAGNDLATVSIRPRAIVGPNDQVLLPKLAELAARSRMPLPNGGRALIELTDVRDVADATLSALARAADVSGQAFNISGGQPIAVRDLATQLAQILGVAPRMVDLPMPLAKAIASMSETMAHLLASGREPVLTRYILATLGYSQTFDLTPAATHLGWQPKHDAVATLLEQARRMTR